MRNLVLLKEQRHVASNVVDFCHIDDGMQESTVVLTKEGSVIASNWQISLVDSTDWFSITFVDPQIVCLSTKGAIVSLQAESGEQELVGEFDNGILAGKWSPDGEVLALVTVTDNEDGSKNGVLLTMSAEFDVLGEVTLEAFDDTAPISLSWRPDGTLLAINAMETADGVRRIRTYQRESLELHSVGRSEDGSGKVVPNLHPPISWASAGCSNYVASVQRKTKRTQQVVFFEPNGLRHREFVLRSQAKVTMLCWNVLSDILVVVLEEEDRKSKVQLWHRSNYHWYVKYEWQYDSPVLCAKFHEEAPYRLFVSLEKEWREYTCCWDVCTHLVTSDGFTAFAIDGAKLNMTPFHKALVPPPMYAASITLDHCVRQFAGQGDRAVLYLSDGSLALLGQGAGAKSGMIANFTAPTLHGVGEWGETQGVDIQGLRHFVIVKTSESTLYLIAVNSDNFLVEIEIDIERKMQEITNIIPMEGFVLRIVNWSDSPEGALIELEDGELLEYKDGSVLPSSLEPLLEPCPWIAGLYHASDMDADPDHSQRDRLVVGLSTRSRLYCQDRLLADSASSFVVSTAHQFLCYATAGAHCQLRSLALTTLHNFDPLMGSEEQNLDGYEPRNVERGARLVAVLPNQPTAVLQMPRGNLEGIYPRSLVLPFVMSKIQAGEYGAVFTTMRRQKVDLNLIVDLNPHKFLSDGVIGFLEEVKQIDYLNLFISTLQNSDLTQYRYIVPSWFKRTSIVEDVTECEIFDATTKVNQVCQKVRELLMEAEDRKSTVGGRAVADGEYLLPILSTFAKEVPPKLEEALSMISDKAIARHLATSKKPPLLSEKAQSSIQYLAFLADYKLLFNTALGMYDYDLARAVARNSQMDPKIYLPLLKRLRSLPEYFAMFEVDLRLERYESALSNLYKSGFNDERLESFEGSGDEPFGNTFEQCLALIEKHKLHRLGLQLYSYDAAKRSLIMKSLGQHFLGEGKAQAALSVFLSAEPADYDGAKRAARICGDWRYFFTLSVDSSADATETVEIRNRRLAYEIAEEIAAGKSGVSKRDALMDAAKILLDYGSDINGAVDMLISAEMWSEARRLAILRCREDLVKKIVDSAAAYSENLISEFSEKIATFETTTQRYIEVLKIRKDAVRESGLDLGEALEQGDDTGSLFSVASTSSLRSTASAGSMGSVGSVASVSSVISVGNRSTFSMTSEHTADRHKSKFNRIGKKKDKKKKRRQGKKNKMRPGSEEELKSLVSTLKSSCIDVDYATIIGEAALFLSQVGRSDLARQLFHSFENLKKAISECQQKRIEETLKNRLLMERKARMEGTDQQPITLACEAEVDGLLCESLSDVLADLFSFFS